MSGRYAGSASGADALGAFFAKEALALDFKPACSESDLLMRHLKEVEQEAERECGAPQMFAHHVATVYIVRSMAT
jgi:hypothetical protein